jgi:hypothetical protein
MNTKSIGSFFESIQSEEIKIQSEYWGKLKPVNDSERFQRFLFAYTSVHTSWEANVKAYSMIKDWWTWLNRWDVLLEKLIESRVGMHNNRTKFLKDFSVKFWSNPSSYEKNQSESWVDFRNRIEKVMFGLGLAKTSFALEMIYPIEAKVTCLDTHLFQAYGLDQTKDRKKYPEIESNWIKNSNRRSIPPYVARCIYWDRKQQKPDSRYWSHVLEKANN